MADDRDQRKKEDEYFHRKEQEAIEKTRQRLAEEENAQRQQASPLRCPKCGENLEERVFQEIKIDRCTSCHGVWLDAGELEQIAAREDEGWFARFWSQK